MPNNDIVMHAVSEEPVRLETKQEALTTALKHICSLPTFNRLLCDI